MYLILHIGNFQTKVEQIIIPDTFYNARDPITITPVKELWIYHLLGITIDNSASSYGRCHSKNEFIQINEF